MSEDTREEKEMIENEEHPASDENKNPKTESSKEVKKDIKKAGQFGKGHQKTRKAAILYILEDIRDVLIRAKDWCVTNYRTSIPAGICLILLIVVAVAIIRNARLSTPDEEAANNQPEIGEDGAIPVPDVPLEENAYDHINQFVLRYYDACTYGDVDTYVAMRSYTDDTEKIRMQKKANYIDYYQNIICYTKPGPVENSWLCYVSYELKFRDLDSVAPGLNTLFLCTDENGELYVFSGEVDANVTEYMKAMSTQTDVLNLFRRVTTAYDDAVASDEALRVFMEDLAEHLKADVRAAVAELEAANGGTDVADAGNEGNSGNGDTGPTTAGEASGDGSQEGDGDNSENNDPEPQIPVTDTVVATDTVNVRSSASTEADRLGSVSEGTRLTRLETLDNGWSRVEYNGREGYIKTEYLEVVESANGTVTVLQNVNVRAEASESGTRLGIAYAGSTLELIETQEDGWSRIIYEGRTAYVKSEFVR